MGIEALSVSDERLDDEDEDRLRLALRILGLRRFRLFLEGVIEVGRSPSGYGAVDVVISAGKAQSVKITRSVT